MRKLTWFTLGFGAASAFCAYVFTPGALILPAFLLALLCVFLARKQFWLRGAVLLLLGIAAGIFWFSRFEDRRLEPLYRWDGVTVEASIRFHSYSEKTDYGIRADGRITLEAHSYPVMVYLDEEETIEPGITLTGPFRFQVTAPGGQKDSTYYQGEGIFLLAYQKDELILTRDSDSWRDLPAKLRRQIIRSLEESLPETSAAFAKALLLGDSSDLDYATLTDFAVSGIRHVIAVSGLHVSILFSMVGFFSFRKRLLSALIGFPALLFFAAVTGFTPSVSRACIMSGLMLGASLLNREYDGPTSLSFAGLVLLLWNPLVIASVSYQLSFASVTGIFLFAPGIRKWLQSFFDLKSARRFKRRLVRGFTVSVSVTLGATVATVPLCAICFGSISLAAVLTNLLILWAISLIFYGLIALWLLSGIWHTGAVILGKLLLVLIQYVLLTAKVIAGFPLSAVYTKSPYIALWLVLVYLLLFAFLLSKNRKPVTFACCCIVGLCMALLASWAEPLQDDLRFTVLDVGQGQCLLLQAEGKTYLVDCGGSSDAMAADSAAETLLSQGISRLDALILTHYDRDHAGGVPGLLSRVDTELLILPPKRTEQPYPAARTVYAGEDLLLSSGNTKIHIFAPVIGGDDNENSICVLFDTENCDILVTGDRDGFGERMLLRNARIPEVDVLVAGHHGSKNATCDELLTAVHPEIVCISVGQNNFYGHPAPELLQRLSNYGCSIYRTDLQGDITIRR